MEKKAKRKTYPMVRIMDPQQLEKLRWLKKHTGTPIEFRVRQLLEVGLSSMEELKNFTLKNE